MTKFVHTIITGTIVGTIVTLLVRKATQKPDTSVAAFSVGDAVTDVNGTSGTVSSIAANGLATVTWNNGLSSTIPVSALKKV